MLFRSYVVAVWCGHKSGRSGGEALVGKRAAAPVAWQVVRALYPSGGAPWFARPEAVVAREVCAVSGRPPGPLCGRLVSDWALRQCSSCATCPVHARGAEGQTVERWPAEVSAYLAARAGGGDMHGQGLKIAAPAEGTAVRLVDGVGGQRIAFKVTGAQPGEPVYWFRNDALVGTSSGGAAFLWSPERGAHRFVCAALSGSAAEVSIRVE